MCVWGGEDLRGNTPCDTDHLQHVRKVKIKGVCGGEGRQRKQLLADTYKLQTSHQGKYKKRKNYFKKKTFCVCVCVCECVRACVRACVCGGAAVIY